MHLMKTLAAVAIVALASCTPETYIDPIADDIAQIPDAQQERPDGSAEATGLSTSEAATTLPVLQLDTPHLWTGCHGEGRMTFRADSTMTWELDGPPFDSPYLLDGEGNLYPGCAEDCESMLPYRYDADRRIWRQFDGYCWYDLTPVP